MLAALLCTACAAFAPTTPRLFRLRLRATNENAAAASWTSFNLGSWTATARTWTAAAEDGSWAGRPAEQHDYTLQVTQEGADCSSYVERWQWADPPDGLSLVDGIEDVTVQTDGDAFDVDIDGTYSRDANIADVRGWTARFVVEHSLALTDARRLRLHAMYGFSGELSRIALFDETRDGELAGAAGAAAAAPTTTAQEDALLEGAKLAAKGSPERQAQLAETLARRRERSGTAAPAAAVPSVRESKPLSLIALTAGTWQGDATARQRSARGGGGLGNGP